MRPECAETVSTISQMRSRASGSRLRSAAVLAERLDDDAVGAEPEPAEGVAAVLVGDRPVQRQPGAVFEHHLDMRGPLAPDVDRALDRVRADRLGRGHVVRD
jgi:hypothetical protein